ncbi:MAG: hypothetical protein AAF226_04905 [Verrucomicrobiota bacterium]
MKSVFTHIFTLPALIGLVSLLDASAQTSGAAPVQLPQRPVLPSAPVINPCGTDIIKMQTAFETKPEALLQDFEDFIMFNPDCIGDILQTAITVSEAKGEKLTSLIHVALIEYPREVSKIAESALIAAPDQADTIKKAFQTRAVAMKKEEAAKPKNAKKTPIERFLASHKQKAMTPDDMVAIAMAKIDEMLGAKQQDEEIPETKQPEEFKVSIPDEELSEMTLAKGLEPSAPGVESVLNNPNAQEVLANVAVNTVVDPDAGSAPVLGIVEQPVLPAVVIDVADVQVEQPLADGSMDAVSGDTPTSSLSETTPEEKTFRSQVYPIGLRPGEMAWKRKKPIIRSVPLSPTQPR